jgi:Calcineurin-like phosphoesterase
MTFSLIQSLPSDAVDVVGDVHGEIDALHQLVGVLGYDQAGRHPEGRSLVFVGDLCDRGPDSPAVIDWVRRRRDEGRVQCVLGNHELNLMRGQRKDGNDWLYGDVSAEGQRYLPFAMLAKGEQQSVLEFFDSLPVALEGKQLRVVHAAWHSSSVDALRPISDHPLQAFNTIDQNFKADIENRTLASMASEEKLPWQAHMHNEYTPPPLLQLTGKWNARLQMGNPIRVMTSGIEKETDPPFFAGGAWRFVERAPWWDAYQEATPVIFGHYWRRWGVTHPKPKTAFGPNLFYGIDPDAWFGARRNVFCCDFSVGGRFVERKNGVQTGFLGRLGALRWPERELYFDDGTCLPTQHFQGTP